MKKLTVALIGAGSRGQGYTNLMDPNKFQVVAVADPIAAKAEYIRDRHGIPANMCFKSWEDMLAQPKLADVAIISTQDQMHYAPAMKAIEKGYDLLLEKPIAPTARECEEIAGFAKEKGVKILVCHVLRYTPFFRKIKDLINEGKLGTVLSVHHSECVGNVHQSHSYVRGNWGNTAESTNMLLAKSCHDMDIIQWLIGSKCTRAQSFGSLTYFTPENAPEGAPEYCMDGCPHGETCFYNAKKLYYEDKDNFWFRRACTNKIDPSDEEVAAGLRKTQYGKCIFKCNNDVVDHQVVNLEFANSAVASFNMSAFNKGGRTIRVMGTKGEIYGDMGEDIVTYFDFATREKEILHPASVSHLDETLAGGHAGGDEGIVEVLYEYLVNDYQGDLLSEIEVSKDNHMIAFAAEESRLTNKVIDVDAYVKSVL